MVFRWFWGHATIGFDGLRWLSTIGPTMEWLHTIVDVYSLPYKAEHMTSPPLASSSPTILAKRSSIRLMLASASLLAIATFSLFASLFRLLFSSLRFASSGSSTNFLTENQSRTGQIVP